MTTELDQHISDEKLLERVRDLRASHFQGYSFQQILEALLDEFELLKSEPIDLVEAGIATPTDALATITEACNMARHSSRVSKHRATLTVITQICLAWERNRLAKEQDWIDHRTP
jgi:hypothetical protein